MTALACTIGSGATVVEAARLLGILSWRDALSVFSRKDEGTWRRSSRASLNVNSAW
ncbi:hypothetical protein BC739_007779 [Kutzneria viridogrisea]|uniref:Uncharacterized protein n=1 Tax=Kutzneria viridogrisea TaxID=47990 RepID=A0ABR6BVD6_9PSEU|nr:hypothetical protein [Kutzneria viridogrisea]